MTRSPKAIIVISGKRKAGKDFVADVIQKKIGTDVCTIMRLSGPLKEIYAKEHDLNFEELMNSSGYKEIHRAEMIKWGEEKRKKDPSYFCCLATSGPNSEKPVWIISDARRKTDIVYFKDTYSDKTKLVRVRADSNVREKRGFVFTPGVDDAESECGLDCGVDWDFVIDNNSDPDVLKEGTESIVHIVEDKLKNS